MPTATPNDARITSGPITFTNPLPSRGPRKPFNSTPISGNRGTSHAWAIRPLSFIRSSLHHADFVHVDAVALPEDRDNDAQAHRDLGSGHRHHEESENLAVGLPIGPGESDKGQVH